MAKNIAAFPAPEREREEAQKYNGTKDENDGIGSNGPCLNNRFLQYQTQTGGHIDCTANLRCIHGCKEEEDKNRMERGTRMSSGACPSGSRRGKGAKFAYVVLRISNI